MDRKGWWIKSWMWKSGVVNDLVRRYWEEVEETFEVMEERQRWIGKAGGVKFGCGRVEW